MKMVEKASAFKRWVGGLAASLLVTSTALTPAYASDTEVYARVVDFSGDVTPVLMMVLDSSGSMLFCMDGDSSCEYPKIKRIDMLRNSMRKILFGSPTGTVVKPAPDYMKMGYTRFNPDANDGGWTRYPALKLSSTIPDKWTETATIETRVKDSASDAVVAVPTNITGATYLMGSDTIGVRFGDLQIPRNAEIKGAFLTFFRPDTSGTIPSRVEIRRESTTDAAPYSAANDPASVLRTYASSNQVDVETPSSQSWLVGIVTMNVTDMVQEQVKQAAWCGGNAMAFKLAKGSGQTKSFKVLSNDGAVGAETDARPSLTVTYTITGSDRSSSCINAPVDVVAGVKTTLDDVEWADAADVAVSYREPLLQPGAVPDGVRNQVGLRFTNLPILSGATIDKAWLYVTQAQSAATNTATVEVAAIAADNASPFCTQNAVTKEVTCTTPSTASLTTAATMALPASAVDGVHAAIDVTAPVAAIVSRPGWATNNALAFVLRNSSAVAASSETSIYSVDGGLSKGAILHVVMRKQYTNLDNIDKTARQDLFDDINTRMYAEGGTPLGDAYTEAARYMLGMKAYSVDTFTTTFTDQAPEQTYRQPDPRTTTTTTSTTYQSPIEETGECSANYLFMMSDGVPNNASNVNNNSGGVTSGYNPDCNAYSKLPVSTGNSQANFACMASVATHLASANNQKKALIRTNTVLFDADPSMTSETVQDMAMVAKAGKGSFFHAKNENQLTDALLKTLTTLLDETGSITAPGVAVNQFNRLTHLDQLYYAVFDPDTGKSRWRGNVKRYRLNFTATDASIVDKNNAEAIDPATTFFSTNAHSFWSPTKDGNTAVLGGVSSVLPRPEARTIYTYMPAYSGSTMTLESLGTVAAATGRAAVTGLTVDEQFNNLRKWLYGYAIDVADTSVTPKIIKKTAISVSSTTQTRNEVGGVLHSQPVLVNYGYTGTDPAAAQTDASKQDNMVFFSTMEGMLHAVNANTGVEKFAFIPKETLSRAAVVALNDQQSLPEFGLDVTWSVYRVDSNADLKINAADGDKVWLFGGMRMGGSNYYALDVTNRDAPKLKWVIQGGTGAGAFGSMGQTWSKPSIGQIKVGGVVKNVLFIGGGYDPKHENAGFNSVINASDAKGNQIYIVDADNGNLLWSASSSGSPSMTVSALRFSIPSELKLFDANSDGLVDAAYFGDLGGQVFRLDIDNEASSNSAIGVRVKRLANVGQRVTADTTNQRRFYEAPGAAVMIDGDGLRYVAVALGSGYRSHPLDLQTQDAFYVFRDYDILRSDRLTATDLQATITPSDLAEVDLGTTAGVDITGKKGWMLELPASGEKVLSTPLILFGEVFFTTYIPNLASEGKCKPVIGASSLWRVSASDGAASFDFNKDGSITTADRYQEGMVQGLGGAPQLLIGDDGKNAVITGTGVERNKDLGTPTMRRTRWYEKAK